MSDPHTLKGTLQSRGWKLRQEPGQDVSGYEQKEPAETADGPWQRNEKESTSQLQLQVSQVRWPNPPLVFLPCFPPRDPQTDKLPCQGCRCSGSR